MCYNVIMNNIDDKLITENLGLVRQVLSRLYIMPNCVDYDDYLQVGCIGLFKAIRDYDSTRGYKLSTYAYKSIYNEVCRYYYRNHIIKYKSSKKLDLQFTEIEPWMELSEEDITGLNDKDYKNLNKIRNTMGQDGLELALDLIVHDYRIGTKNMTNERIKYLQEKYKNYVGVGASALRNGQIRVVKFQIIRKIRECLGLKKRRGK